MRTRGVFVATLFVAFVVLSWLADRGSSGEHVMTGIVLEWQADELIAVANEQTDPAGVRILLRNTADERDRRAITPGTRVTVWYRSVGEGRPVADKVSVLADPTP
jgi:hypothetical protein